MPIAICSRASRYMLELGETHLLSLECGDIRSGFSAPAPVIGPLWQYCQGGPAVRQADCAMRKVSAAPAYCGDPLLFESLKGVGSPNMQSTFSEAHLLRICGPRNGCWPLACRAVQRSLLTRLRLTGVRGCCLVDPGQWAMLRTT